MMKKFHNYDIEVTYTGPNSGDKPRQLADASPTITAFSLWFGATTGSVITRSEREMMKMFLYWLAMEERGEEDGAAVDTVE